MEYLRGIISVVVSELLHPSYRIPRALISFTGVKGCSKCGVYLLLRLLLATATQRNATQRNAFLAHCIVTSFLIWNDGSE